jgi:hypothetical protein
MNYWVDLQFLLGTYFWREDFKRPLVSRRKAKGTFGVVDAKEVRFCG